jgi:hypothetical protein
MAMWTRMVAGAAAHDLNNLAQGLYNLLSLAASPSATPAALERYAALARDGLKDLRRLGADLRALADARGGNQVQRLDLVCRDAVTEVEAPPDRAVELGPLATDALVAGTSVALRLAIEPLVRYGLAASEPGGRVRVSVGTAGGRVTVLVAAPTAPPPRAPGELPLVTRLAGVERELGGDAGLVLAGAVAAECGGEISAGPGPEGGLSFKLSLPRAEEGPQEELESAARRP